MAITNAQQYKQLVNPPMEGKKRPGYRGEAAAASDKDAGRSAGRDTSAAGTSNVGGDFDRGSFQAAQRMGEARQIAKNLAEDKAFEQQGFETLRVKDSNFPGIGGMILNALKGPRQKLLDRNIDFFRNDPRTRKAREKYGLTAQGYKNYMKDRLAGDIDAAGNPIMTGDDDDNVILPVDTTFNMAPSNMDQEPKVEDPFVLARRFRADGGIMNANVVGGEMDFESARQMYGLGKLVKKATRVVKKIAKSPIGKAAIAYTLTGGLGNLAQGQRFFTGFTSPGTFLGGAGKIFSREGLRNIAFGVPGSRELVGTMPSGKPLFKTIAESSGLIGSGGQFSALKGITAASILPLLGIGTGDESEEEARAILDNTGIDIEAARNSILQAAKENYAMDARARGFKADGGLMRIGYQEGSKEPVAKKTMPLLDMGGKEMDLREDGGFVPIGRMEKADDVPARLSKNEFVFTADAVRNAGDGDVDKGAEVMYNMMKNLEAGGDVSEESQGLEGARKMFQTSQRLEEVL